MNTIIKKQEEILKRLESVGFLASFLITPRIPILGEQRQLSQQYCSPGEQHSMRRHSSFLQEHTSEHCLSTLPSQTTPSSHMVVLKPHPIKFYSNSLPSSEIPRAELLDPQLVIDTMKPLAKEQTISRFALKLASKEFLAWEPSDSLFKSGWVAAAQAPPSPTPLEI